MIRVWSFSLIGVLSLFIFTASFVKEKDRQERLAEIMNFQYELIDPAIHYTPIDHAAMIADSLISASFRYLGTRYVWGGSTPRGFDCSGFTKYAYNLAGIKIPQGSRNQAKLGEEVDIESVKKGDLLVFTGTNVRLRQPGHVGIVISEPGEPIEFIHSSSRFGVRTNKFEDGSYPRRFLQVRRLIQ